MKMVTLLFLDKDDKQYVMRAFNKWEKAQETADEYNNIYLKERIEGIFYTRTLIVE